MDLKELLHKPNLFARIFGIKLDKFLMIVGKICYIWDEAERKRLENKKRKRAIGGGRKYKLKSIEEKILLLLMFYRHNMTHEILGVIFGLDTSNVTRLINKMLPIFEKAVDPKLKKYFINAKKDSIKISSVTDFFTKYPDLKSIKVDATEQRRYRPKDKNKRKKVYSGKKKIFANKTQILIDEKLRILDVSQSYPGSIHDKKIFNLENTINKIPEQTTLLGDLGYLGIPKENPTRKVILPHKKRKGQKKLSLEQRKFNHQQASQRVVVEHVIGRIKKFRICSDLYRGKERNYNQIFRNVTALVNLNYYTI